MWDKITLGFDVEEETVNFGCRKMAICDSAVYETNTLAIFSNENEDEEIQCDKTPRVTCMSYTGSDSGIIVTIDESLITFDSTGAEMKNRCTFNATIDCFAVSAVGSLLFVVLSNGDVHCLLLNSNRNHIFLKNLGPPTNENEKRFVNIFIREKENICDLILVAYDGCVHKLRDINISELVQVCISQAADSIVKLTDSLIVDQIYLTNAPDENLKVALAYEYYKFGEHFLLMIMEGNGRQELQIWSSENELLDFLALPSELNLKKVHITKNGNLIYGLTSSGTLLVICSYTFTPILHLDDLDIVDFEILSEEEESLLVLTKKPSQQLQLLSIPGFKPKFSLDVNKSSFLARNQTSLDDLLYLEGQTKKDDGPVVSLHLKIITESQPEYRLERILRRGKFEEAEQFAKSFNLDIELVYKAHLRALSSDIQPWSNCQVPLEESGCKLKNLLSLVKDIEFVAQCAINAISSDFTLMKDILTYAENRIRAHPDVNPILQDYYNRIRNSLLRLSTFVAISEKPLTVEKWLLFCKVNLIEECQSLLKQGFLDQVILIWSRHIHQIKDQLSYDDALNFLKSFPPFAPIKNLLRWLRIFLPDCFVLFPNMLRNVVTWCKEKVNMMELQELSEWPQSGVWFLKKLLKIIRRNVQPCKISSENIIQSEYAGDSPIKDVLYYIKILNEITMVKEKHGILISIAEYTQDNDKEVMFTILDKMPLEELRSFVNGFFKELILERNLHSDGIISENIRLLVEGSTDWWYWDEAPWEGRVAVLIDCITGIEEKLKCVLSVLKHSPVPWSVTVMNICEDALKHKNPLTKLISEQRKLVDCKLIMKKYNLKDNILTKSHVNRIILYIFAQNQPTMLEDSLQIANTFDFEMSTEVYKLYAQHLIEKGEFNAVLSFLDDDNLPLKVVLKCCEHIIVRTHCLSSRKCLRAVYDNYIEVLDSVNSKLLRAICKLQKDGELITSVVSSGICKQLKCDYYLKTEFNIDAASEHFKPGEYDKMLNHCLMSILKNMLRDPKSMEKESMKLSMLSTCFEFNKEEIYIKFIDLAISQSEITVAVYASRLLMKESVFSPQVAKQLINLGSLILRHCIKMRRDSTVTSIDSNITFVLYELVVAGMNTCAPDCLEKGLEISNWCKLTKCSPQLDCASELSAGKIQPSYTQSMNFTTWLSLLATYGQFLDENNMKSSIIFVNDPNLNDTSEPQGMYELVNCLQNLVKNEQEQISFQAVTTTHWSLLRQCFAFNHPIAEVSLVAQTKTVSTQFISKLLKKLIGSRHLDCHYGLALLHYFPLEEATNWIMESTKRFRHDFQRLYSITELGMVYFHKNKCAQQWSTIYKLRKQCVWGKQIMEYGLSYKEAFRDTQQDQCQLLLKLMAVPSMNVDVLAKYCKDVNFDFQSCLKVYLKQILLSWEPEFEVKADAVTGDKALVVKPTHVKLLQKCHDICSLIENVAEINQSIATIMGSVNNYYYEVFLILITLLEEKGVKADTTLFSLHRAVLLFLSSYQRISKPQEYEKENWYQLYPNEQSLPSISEYRLPFRLIYPRLYKGEPWKIIQHELNINTYTKWFAVLDALELDKNVLCSLAINQITTDGVIDQEINNEWCTYLRNQKLLADVKACVENITNLEMSCASLYYVVNHLPPGADQLAAAKLCFMYAKRWRETEKSDKAESGFQKVQKKYLTISTTHILYIHNLGKPHYLQLVLKPSELIIALYGDPIILQKNTGNEIVFPDINKATEEISTLHKIDVMKLRMELLEEWLQPENFIANVSCDETIIRQHNSDGITETKFSDVEYQNFQRACYVVERDIMTFGKNLTIIVFDHNSDDSKPISVRLRALQCLYAVCTKDKMEQITEKSLDELWNLLNTLKFVMELEALGLTYSVPMFESCDKSEIVRSLLTLKNPKAVRLAAYMSRYFKINHSTIWNSLLNHMCSYEMILELSEVLPDLSRNYHTLDLVVFEKAWSTVLKLPIEKAPQFPSEEDTEIIERSVELLYFCPIIDQIDLNYIKQLYLKINRSDLADSICNMNI